MPSVVTWWQVAAVAPVASVAAAPASVPAVAPPTGGQKAVRKRSREVDAVVTGPEAQPRAKRERSQTQLYDPVVEATRHSPVNPEAGVLDPAAEQKQDSRRRRASAGAPGMLAGGKQESTWPAAWKKLLGRSVPVPRENLPDGGAPGLEEPSYVQQMRGTRSRYYIGRPVRVLTGGKWESAVIAALEEVGGKRQVMLASGKEAEFEAAERAGQLKFDERAAGDFAVGRHAQVQYDGGMWFIGVVAAVTCITPGVPSAVVLHFEDGDRAEVKVGYTHTHTHAHARTCTHIHSLRPRSHRGDGGRSERRAAICMSI